MTTNELRLREIAEKERAAKETEKLRAAELAETQRQFNEPDVARLRAAKVYETEQSARSKAKEASLRGDQKVHEIIKSVKDIAGLLVGGANVAGIVKGFIKK